MLNVCPQHLCTLFSFRQGWLHLKCWQSIFCNIRLSRSISFENEAARGEGGLNNVRSWHKVALEEWVLSCGSLSVLSSTRILLLICPTYPPIPESSLYAHQDRLHGCMCDIIIGISVRKFGLNSIRSIAPLV